MGMLFKHLTAPPQRITWIQMPTALRADNLSIPQRHPFGSSDIRSPSACCGPTIFFLSFLTSQSFGLALRVSSTPLPDLHLACVSLPLAHRPLYHVPSSPLPSPELTLWLSRLFSSAPRSSSFIFPHCPHFLPPFFWPFLASSSGSSLCLTSTHEAS